jgi:CBS domain-containing protein
MDNDRQRAETFLQLFNRLEDELQTIAGTGHGTRFFELVERAAHRNPIVRRASGLLKDCGDLRNLLVHSRDFPRAVPAVPTDEALLAMSRVVDALTRPRRLEQVASRMGRVFRPDEALGQALRYMRQQGFAQVAVVGPDGTSLLTARGIARWLEERVDGEPIDPLAATVGDALTFEGRASHQAMARDATIDDARQAFVDAVERGERLLAIVVTEHGRLSERPIGIITPWDLLEDVTP